MATGFGLASTTSPASPVLTAGPTPDVDTASWTLRIGGMVAQDAEWSWEEFHELVFEEVPCDLHCMTSWSKLGTREFGALPLLDKEVRRYPPDACGHVTVTILRTGHRHSPPRTGLHLSLR